MAVVLAVDRHDLEPGRQRLDLAQEVLRGEPALAQGAGQRVGRGGQGHPGVGSRVSSVDISTVSPGSSSSNSSMQTSRWPRNASTVWAKPSAPTRLVYSTNVPKALGPRPRARGGQQVRLADAEAAVEVDAPPPWASPRRRSRPAAPAATAVQRRGEAPRGAPRPPPGWAAPGRDGRSRTARRRTSAAAPARRPVAPAGPPVGGRSGRGCARIGTRRQRSDWQDAAMHLLLRARRTPRAAGLDDDALAPSTATRTGHRRAAVATRQLRLDARRCGHRTGRPLGVDQHRRGPGGLRAAAGARRRRRGRCGYGARRGYRRVVPARSGGTGAQAAGQTGTRRRRGQPLRRVPPCWPAAGGVGRRRPVDVRRGGGHGPGGRPAALGEDHVLVARRRSPSTWPPASPTWRAGACRGSSARAAPTCSRDLLAAGVVDELGLTLVPHRDQRRPPAHHRRRPGHRRPASAAPDRERGHPARTLGPGRRQPAARNRLTTSSHRSASTFHSLVCRASRHGS